MRYFLLILLSIIIFPMSAYSSSLEGLQRMFANRHDTSKFCHKKCMEFNDIFIEGQRYRENSKNPLVAINKKKQCTKQCATEGGKSPKERNAEYAKKNKSSKTYRNAVNAEIQAWHKCMKRMYDEDYCDQQLEKTSDECFRKCKSSKKQPHVCNNMCGDNPAAEAREEELYQRYNSPENRRIYMELTK